MVHPFFSVLSYPWHRPEAKNLHKLLTAAIATPNQINLLYQQCLADLPPLSLVVPPNEIWMQVLQNLTARSALRQLLDLVLAQFAMNESIKTVIREIENAQPAIETRIFSDDLLVLDRVSLREKLTLIEPDETPVKVLLVRGGSKSGKSYGRFLFERAARDQGAVPVYLCDAIVATVDEVVMNLFGPLEALNEIPVRLTTENAWYKLVCIKLQAVAASKRQRLWVAVDDLGPAPDGAPLLDPEIRKFCDQFALNMLNPAFRQWFRLMLIHYPDGTVPTNWKQDFWTEDRTSEADVLQKDVEELLRLWSATHDRKIIEDELTELAGKVIAKAENPVAPGQEVLPRLQRIHDALAETLKDLARR